MKGNMRILLGLIILISITISCSPSDDSYVRGNWVQRSIFDGTPRSNAVGFVLDNMGYAGTGYDGDDYLNDFWQYNMDGDYWVQKASFPGVARTSASGFSLNGKGYIGIGYDGLNELSDFWQYAPDTNSWIQKADFGGGVRMGAVEFGANNIGYIGTGYDGSKEKKDFWKYDPNTDTWTEIYGFGGNKRRDATTFVINDKVYLGTGLSNGSYVTDFWEFDPATEVWTSKLDLDDDSSYSIVRSNAVGFTIDGLGYIATGYNGGAVATLWEYDPSTDLWENITSLEGSVRQDAVSFSTGYKGFVLFGRSGSYYLDDIYELFPQQEYDSTD
ncbi:Kelch repeat-containing protein [Yeosuana sp.]|mgnify:CR=1 FL=1|uniref:Kelch repeat-containing protein n=1 Tax=Yeosuana sp. TaxID=2529388 RepID=UPI004054E064